jgi:hypothetical protein
MENKKTVFDELFHLDVNERVEKKKTGNTQLSYLSWSWAWAEVKKRFENATYIIHKFENNLPYVYDENTGYMVFTSVTIDGITHEMWLPVMDGANNAMKSETYTYEVNDYKYNPSTKRREVVGKIQKSVEPATMFDINKTIMRCLVKNLAMFGLGLYIYSGEDLPEEEPIAQASDEQKEQVKGLIDRLANLTNRSFENTETLAFNHLKVNGNTNSLNTVDYGKLIAYLQPTVAKFELKAKEDEKAKENKEKIEEVEREGLPLEYPEAKK